MSSNEYHANFKRNIQQRWHALGLCVDCGKPSEPYWRCKECRVRVCKHNEKYHSKHREHLRKKARDRWRRLHPNAKIRGEYKKK